MITIQECSKSTQNVIIMAGVGYLASWALTNLSPLLGVNPLLGAVSMGIGQVFRQTPVNKHINELTSRSQIINWLAKIALVAAATTLICKVALASVAFEVAFIGYGKLFLLVQLVDYVTKQTSMPNYVSQFAD